MFWQEIFKNNLKEIICEIKDVYEKKMKKYLERN